MSRNKAPWADRDHAGPVSDDELEATEHAARVTMDLLGEDPSMLAQVAMAVELRLLRAVRAALVQARAEGFKQHYGVRLSLQAVEKWEADHAAVASAKRRAEAASGEPAP